MMGTHHAISGAAAWVALTSTSSQLPALGLLPLAGHEVALGALICAGAALLPDADHHNATIAHSLPVAGKLATGVVRRASGGHRHGTHSLLSAFAVLVGAQFLMGLNLPMAGIFLWLSAAAAAATIAFAVKVLKLVRRWGQAWIAGGAVALALTLAAPELWRWLPLCIAVGWVAHLAGDFLTTGGLPLFWPLRLRAPRFVRKTPVIRQLWSAGGYFALPVLGNAGSKREWALMIPTSVYALAGVAFALDDALPLDVMTLLSL